NALQEATALADSHDLQQLAAQGWLALASTTPDPEHAEFALEHAAFTVDQAQDERLSAALHEKRGDLAAARGHMGTALTAYREALAALDKASDPNLFAKARLLQNQGELLARRDDPNSAARYFERALELMTRLQGSEHPDLVHPLTGLGTIAQGRGQ